MRHAVQDITIEKNENPTNRIEIKLDGNLITNEIYHLAEVVGLYTDSEGTTYATNYQPFNPSGILLNRKGNENDYIFKPYKFRKSYGCPCYTVLEKWDKERAKALKDFGKKFKKNFLTFFNYFKKIGYNNTIHKQGEFKKMDKSLFLKPVKTKLESITEKADKFMGLTISINDPKKMEFFWINKLDESKYAYYAIGIAAREIEITSKKSGKKLSKLVFEFDHLKEPVYIAKGTALMACNADSTQPYGLVAINKDEFNKALIADLDSLTQSEPNIIVKVDKSNKDNFKVIY